MGKGKGKKRRRERGPGGLEEAGDVHGRSSSRFDAANSSDPVPVASAASAHPAAYRAGVGGTVAGDEWQTTRRTWAAIADHFAVYKTQRVWMPFYYDGACAEHLRSLGFTDVVHDDVDFFERAKDARFMKSVDLIWDNPPYSTQSTKEAVLTAIAATGKPFALLLPVSIVHVPFVRPLVPMDCVQLIFPKQAWVSKQDGGELGFKYLCWFCCRTALERDAIFIDG